MSGEWKESGYYQAGPRRVQFDSSETVKSAAGGTALIIVGLHGGEVAPGRRVVFHDVVGLVRFNDRAGKYKLTAQLANGLSNEYELKVQARGFSWVVPNPVTKKEVHYTMKLSTAGEWIEQAKRLKAHPRSRPLR